MLAVAVDVEVTEGGEAAFIAATLANCKYRYASMLPLSYEVNKANSI
jgi:hypothetical protein